MEVIAKYGDVMTLKYRGTGQGIMGIPARDLPDDEIDSIAARDGQTVKELIAALTGSGLYAQDKPKATPKAKTEPEPEPEKDE